MTLGSAIKNGFRLIKESERELRRLKKRALEDVLENYVLLLLASGMLAAIVSILWSLGKGVYYHLFHGATVNYLILLNFSVSIAASVFFLYAFIGTFGLGLLGLVTAGALRTSYVQAIKLLCTAATPVLLFGWLSQRLALALLVWALVLVIVGSRAIRED